MQVTRVEYHTATGWAHALPAELDSPRTLVLAFGAWSLRDKDAPFAELRRAFPHSVLAGCSTAGEIAGAHVHDASVSVAITAFERTTLRAAHTASAGIADSAGAGQRLAEALRADEQGQKLAAVFILSHGVNVNGTELVHGLAAHLPHSVHITGGLAGDDAKFENTWVLAHGAPVSGVVSAVGLYGDALEVGVGVNGGWQDFGPERLITRAEGAVLYELDGRPALDLYKEFLGDFAAELPGSGLLFPLSVTRRGTTAPPVVRTLLGIDESARALIFAGDIPQGSVARLMRTTNEQLVQAASAAVDPASGALGGTGPALVVSVSCVGRRLLLGERTDEETEAVLEGVPEGSAHVGFYSNGEIASAVLGAPSELHNQTITVTAYRER